MGRTEHRGVLVAGVAFVAIATTIGATSLLRQPEHSSLGVSATTAPPVAFPETVLHLADASTITALVTEPARAGVWTFTVTSAELRVWHDDPETGRTDSWVLGDGGALGGGFGGHAFAVCDNAVWYGVGHHLIQLDRVSGVVTDHTIPDGTNAYYPGPPDFAGLWGVSSLACNDSTVLVGMLPRADVLSFEISSRQFTPLQLPPDTLASSVALTAGGAFAVGVQDEPGAPHRVLLGDATLVEVSDSTHVTATADGFRAGTQLIGVDGTVTPAPPDPAGSELVAPGANGGVDVMRDGAVVAHFDLGTQQCIPAHQPFVPATSTTSTTLPDSCPIGVRAAVIDVAGNVYAISGDGESVLRLR